MDLWLVVVPSFEVRHGTLFEITELTAFLRIIEFFSPDIGRNCVDADSTAQNLSYESLEILTQRCC